MYLCWFILYLVCSRNKGLSDHLVRAGLEFARENNLLVIPSCPVVEAYVKRHHEYKDLLI